MEHCDLGTMQAALRGGAFRDEAGAVRLDYALSTAKELCAAVAFLHASGVVHGDLKSTNVLLKSAAATRHDARGFSARVSDFGLSRVLDLFEATAGAGPCLGSGGGPGGQCFGALTHAAPELLGGAPMGRASDVYAVGVLLWELATCEVRGRGAAGAMWGRPPKRPALLFAVSRAPQPRAGG
jgi:serine/threonine protein kinase